jgi:hypothetical protein
MVEGPPELLGRERPGREIGKANGRDDETRQGDRALP